MLLLRHRCRLFSILAAGKSCAFRQQALLPRRKSRRSPWASRLAVLLIECRIDGSLSRRERRKLVSLARHDVGGEPILARRQGTALVLTRISRRGARHDRITNLESVAHMVAKRSFGGTAADNHGRRLSSDHKRNHGILSASLSSRMTQGFDTVQTCISYTK